MTDTPQELQQLAEKAARQWFAEAQQEIESQKTQYSHGMKDFHAAAQASLDAAIVKLASIISAVFAPSVSPQGDDERVHQEVERLRPAPSND